MYIANGLNSIINACQREKIEFEILVVDNGSTDDSVMILQQYQNSHPLNVKPMFLPENCGTTVSRNIALRLATGRYICICDSDTEISSGSIRDLLALFENQSQLAIIAPQLFLDDGSIQNSVKKFPNFLCKLVKIPNVLFGIPRHDLDFYSFFPFTEITEVDTAISACWFFQKDLLTEVGLLDERIFYSPEDLDYCIRVRKAGKKIIYYPYLRVLHHTQQVSHKRPFSKTSLSHLYGLMYYFSKHGGWFFSKKF